MHDKPYASALGNLMYTQVCTHFDISFIVGVLGRYLSNPSIDHWIAVKRVMRYLKRTKDYMLIYWKSEKIWRSLGTLIPISWHMVAKLCH